MQRSLLMILLTLALASSGCTKKEEASTPAPSPDAGQQKDSAAAAEAQGRVNRERDEFVKQVETEMEGVNAEIEKLQKKANAASGNAKAKLEREMQTLGEERRALEEKVAELRAASGRTWEGLKSLVEAALDRLKRSMQKLKDQSA
jgi:chromosome segregation ATPase